MFHLGARMAFSTVADAFIELLKRIELNPARVTLASQRYNAIKMTIEGALPGKTVSQIGSFQRKTKIRPADLGDALDVDAVVNFKRFTEYARSGDGTSPSQALETVRRALASNETYRVMTPQKDHPVVTLQYADDMKLELTPAFADATGARPHPGTAIDCYIIGTASGDWEPAELIKKCERLDWALCAIPSSQSSQRLPSMSLR
jgi:Second Messenger Oligonucleotide or Dinucleotide Synthetase domain